MATHLDIPPGHPLRDRNWRPPNPSWASEETIARVRNALREIDVRLDVWWRSWDKPDDPKRPGRWGIVYWLKKQHCWSLVFLWESTGGEFRELSIDSIQPIVNYLAEIDEERQPVKMRQRLAESEVKAADARKKSTADFQAAVQEAALDYNARNDGVRQTFGPGYIRRLWVPPSEVRESNYSRFLRDSGVMP